jgi:hypothetical protein
LLPVTLASGKLFYIYVAGKRHGALRRTNEELISQIRRVLRPINFSLITLTLITADGQVVALQSQLDVWKFNSRQGKGKVVFLLISIDPTLDWRRRKDKLLIHQSPLLFLHLPTIGCCEGASLAAVLFVEAHCVPFLPGRLGWCI